MKKLCVLMGSCVLLLSSCVTYHISTQSLLEQFASKSKERKAMMVIAPGGCFFPGIANGSDLRTIDVLDKNGITNKLPINNRTGIRITQNNGKKKTFYFNTIVIKDSTILGSKTHFVSSHIKPITLCNIRKIEVQK